MKVLVVDDSAFMRKIMIKALNGLGVTSVTEAGDGRAAVECIAKDREYGLVLLDWNMPKVLGIDALRAIRKAGIQIPVIMVTTEAEKSRVMEAIKAGANNYVVKPFKPELLQAKINATIGNGAS